MSSTADLQFILSNVNSMPRIGFPGVLCVYGPEAFAIAVGKQSRYHEHLQPVIAAGRSGAGRLVAFSHDGYLCPEPSVIDAQTLLFNCINWAAGGEADVKPQVGLYKCSNTLAPLLAKQGYTTSNITEEQMDTVDVNSYKVICIGNTNNLSARNNLLAAQKYLENGGGILAANTAWAQWNEDNIKINHPGNKLALNAGIAWSHKPLHSDLLLASVDKMDDVHAGSVWNIVYNKFMDHADDIPEERMKQVRPLLFCALDSICPEDQILLPKIKQSLETSSFPIPTEKNPLKDHTAQVIAYCAGKVMQTPMCAEFPGLATCNLQSTEVKTLELEVGTKAWYSTGLYAPAAETINVEIEDNSPTPSKLAIQIGAHDDNLCDLAQWVRYPIITNRSISGEGKKYSLSVSCNFGGLIYVCTEKDQPKHSITVKISGGIQAPYYVLGQTSLDDWKNTIRHYDAPWGELATSKIILTIPSSYLAKLDDPETLMKHWDEVMDSMADITTLPHERATPFRIVADLEISTGLMHAGYPIMMHLTNIETALDVAALKTTEAWGYYHELGHNHQKSAWTWTGTTEVTNNVLCVYVLNQLCGLTWAQARPDKFEPANLKTIINEYIAGGTKISDWGKPWTALMTFYQLQQKFGWDAYKKVFAWYEKLPSAEEPQTDPAKVDLWIKTFSKTVGQNLVPFFKSWGFSVGAGVEDAVAGLPVWEGTIQDLLK